MRAGNPIEEEQALAVVDLVLQHTGLEGVRLDGDLGARPRRLTSYDDAGGPLDVAGQVGHGHATLAGLLVPRRADHFGVAEHEGTMSGARLRTLGHVDAEHLDA